MKRVLTPELLDELSVEEEAAKKSRDDLLRLNFIMGHHSRITTATRKAPCETGRIVELGAGDGRLMLRMAMMRAQQGVTGQAILVDRRPCVHPATREGLERAGWKLEVAAADVFDWLPSAPPADLIVANLFLHHFPVGQLSRLLSLAAEKCRWFAACEPRRGLAALAASRLLWMIGCNEVTQHDAVISVRAGFRDWELSTLWPGRGWNLREERAGMFSHLFVARKA